MHLSGRHLTLALFVFTSLVACSQTTLAGERDDNLNKILTKYSNLFQKEIERKKRREGRLKNKLKATRDSLSNEAVALKIYLRSKKNRQKEANQLLSKVELGQKSPLVQTFLIALCELKEIPNCKRVRKPPRSLSIEKFDQEAADIGRDYLVWLVWTGSAKEIKARTQMIEDIYSTFDGYDSVALQVARNRFAIGEFSASQSSFKKCMDTAEKPQLKNNCLASYAENLRWSLQPEESVKLLESMGRALYRVEDGSVQSLYMRALMDLGQLAKIKGFLHRLQLLKVPTRLEFERINFYIANKKYYRANLSLRKASKTVSFQGAKNWLVIYQLYLSLKQNKLKQALELSKKSQLLMGDKYRFVNLYAYAYGVEAAVRSKSLPLAQSIFNKIEWPQPLHPFYSSLRKVWQETVAGGLTDSTKSGLTAVAKQNGLLKHPLYLSVMRSQ